MLLIPVKNRKHFKITEATSPHMQQQFKSPQQHYKASGQEMRQSNEAIRKWNIRTLGQLPEQNYQYWKQARTQGEKSVLTKSVIKAPDN